MSFKYSLEEIDSMRYYLTLIHTEGRPRITTGAYLETMKDPYADIRPTVENELRTYMTGGVEFIKLKEKAERVLEAAGTRHLFDDDLNWKRD